MRKKFEYHYFFDNTIQIIYFESIFTELISIVISVSTGSAFCDVTRTLQKFIDSLFAGSPPLKV